ncbi:MAG: hypothetical protein H6719_05155 [Sandaracinaceae bacterium]|nr:hypothetical protein [Sandaracinaceae bacterium]
MKRFRAPKLMVAAVALLAVYGVSAALGLEDWVGVLSGTPVPGVPLELAALGGAAHVLAWFGVVLVAPILVIASALLELSEVMGRVPDVGHRRRPAQ